MQRCLCRGTKRHSNVHEVGILCCPLIRLRATHGPTYHSAEVLDAKFLGDKLILCSHIVVEGTPREWTRLWLVGGRRRLPIAEERRDDNEKVLRVEGFIFSDQPEVVGDGCSQ